MQNGLDDEEALRRLLQHPLSSELPDVKSSRSLIEGSFSDKSKANISKSQYKASIAHSMHGNEDQEGFLVRGFKEAALRRIQETTPAPTSIVHSVCCNEDHGFSNKGSSDEPSKSYSPFLNQNITQSLPYSQGNVISTGKYTVPNNQTSVITSQDSGGNYQHNKQNRLDHGNNFNNRHTKLNIGHNEKEILIERKSGDLIKNKGTARKEYNAEIPSSSKNIHEERTFIPRFDTMKHQGGFEYVDFIREVEKRPCIWDTNDEGYKTKETRVKAWNEIVIMNTPSVTGR